MSETRKMVIEKLKSYVTNIARLEQLQYEMNHLLSRSEQDIIQELSLRGTSLFGGGANRGYVSDKTMKIALEYHDISLRMSNDSVNEIMQEFDTIESEVRRLEKYVSLLDEAESSIIRYFYFEGRSWDNLEAELHTNRRTLQRHRNSAVDELVHMYSYISEFEQKNAQDADNA